MRRPNAETAVPRRRTLAITSFLVCSLLWLLDARPTLAADAGASVGLRVQPPLQPLPKLPSRTLSGVTPEDRKLLDTLLNRLLFANPEDRRVALEDISAIDEGLLPAIRERLDREADKADRAAMKRLLLDVRRDVREQLLKEAKRAGKAQEVQTPDYLEMLVEHPRANSDHYRPLVTVLALSRMCVALQSPAAVRTLIHVYVRFDFLRIDTQLQLERLGDHALPGLIETTRHPAPAIAEWAKRRLDFLGRAIPSEAVAVDDPAVLADVLRAYGYIRDVDAARIVISFANSERALVREAARQALSAYGQPAIWQLRDAYEQVVGSKPSRQWSWDRLAKELFREFDQMRLADLYEHYQKGLQALQGNDLDGARRAFDRVLARSPHFEPSEEMVRAYLAFGEQVATTNPGEAELALRRVQRLTENTRARATAQSWLLTVQAHRLANQGLADRTLLVRALELEPTNAEAKRLLDELQREPLTESTGFARMLWPAVFGALALLFSLLVVLRRTHSSSAASTQA